MVLPVLHYLNAPVYGGLIDSLHKITGIILMERENVMVQAKPVLLFDWGDTLMRDDPGLTTPMADWPHVEALPGVSETLVQIQDGWRFCVASNADVSDEAAIWRALGRVGLDRWIERVYCSRNIGYKKPDPQFFGFILKDLEVKPSQVVMVGDSYKTDILGANASGLRAIWFNWKTPDEQSTSLHLTIHHFEQLPAALAILFR
jgi:FMN phosphatase YigB (HAD superfamily)